MVVIGLVSHVVVRLQYQYGSLCNRLVCHVGCNLIYLRRLHIVADRVETICVHLKLIVKFNLKKYVSQEIHRVNCYLL